MVVIGWNSDWLDILVLVVGWRIGIEGEVVGWKENRLLPLGWMENGIQLIGWKANERQLVG